MTARRPRARVTRLASLLTVTCVVALCAAGEAEARRGGGGHRGGGRGGRSVGHRSGPGHSRSRSHSSHGAAHGGRGGRSTGWTRSHSGGKRSRSGGKRSHSGGKTKGRKGKPHYTYEANMPGGRKYVGMTKNPRKRFIQHLQGFGAKVTRTRPVRSVVKVWRHSSRAVAKRVERLRYFALKRRLGADRVRGAGNTRPFHTGDAEL